MKDPIDFHIRSLEQRIDDMAEENERLEKIAGEMTGELAGLQSENAALTEENAKLKGEIEEKNKVNVALFKQVNFQEEIKSDNKRLREALEEIVLVCGQKGFINEDWLKQRCASALHSDQPKS